MVAAGYFEVIACLIEQIFVVDVGRVEEGLVHFNVCFGIYDLLILAEPALLFYVRIWLLLNRRHFCHVIFNGEARYRPSVTI